MICKTRGITDVSDGVVLPGGIPRLCDGRISRRYLRLEINPPK